MAVLLLNGMDFVAGLFALELRGAKDVRNYFQSWQEWIASDDTPIVVQEARNSRDQGKMTEAQWPGPADCLGVVLAL